MVNPHGKHHREIKFTTIVNENFLIFNNSYNCPFTRTFNAMIPGINIGSVNAFLTVNTKLDNQILNQYTNLSTSALFFT